MLDRGCYLGFDRFGLDFLHPDRLRLAALIGLFGRRFRKTDRALARLSRVLARRGLDLTPEIEQGIRNWEPTHIFKNILPALRKAGDEKIQTLMVENPRNYFEQ